MPSSANKGAVFGPTPLRLAISSIAPSVRCHCAQGRVRRPNPRHVDAEAVREFNDRAENRVDLELPSPFEVLQHRRLHVVQTSGILDARVDIDAPTTPAARPTWSASLINARTSARACGIGEHRADRHCAQRAHRVEPDVVDEFQPHRRANVGIGLRREARGAHRRDERVEPLRRPALRIA